MSNELLNLTCKELRDKIAAGSVTSVDAGLGNTAKPLAATKTSTPTGQIFAFASSEPSHPLLSVTVQVYVPEMNTSIVCH